MALVITPLLGLQGLEADTTDGALRMEVITAYNFVVDSNVESPSTNGPSAAHLGVKIYNDGPTALTGVYVNIGKLTDPPTSAGTPGIFETRVNPQGYTGTFSLQMPGGPLDAVRYIPRIEPGQYVSQYFFVTYPLKDNLGNSVAGAAPVTEDDLWLNYDIWASAQEGVTTRRVDETTKVTMRNEISAMANKIWPNTDGKVPDAYLQAIQNSLGWRPDTSTSRISGAVVMEGIWYDLGNVGAGFDNNGDGLPDRNAWLQPVGNPAVFSPLAARLVKCYGIVVVKLNDGTEQLIPFEDQLYFENIPGNNNGAVGLVYYEFIPLDLSKPSQLSPYQEVASGNDNEKFNGDYGVSVGSVSGTPPVVTFDKNGPVTIAGGSNATYALSATNNEGTKLFGWPDLGLPLVFQDNIPASLVYVAGSATTSNSPPAGQTYAVSWSTDGGTTWVSTEPAAASVTAIRWVLSGALAPGQTAAVSFEATVPTTYPGAIVSNTGCLKKGPDTNFACDTFTTLVSGLNSLGDFVWRDLDRDGVQDGGAETGIANIGVTLYYDTNGDGVLDASDPLYASTQTNSSGIYGFSNLPDGKFLVVVDQNDADLPVGFSLPNSTTPLKSVSLDPTSVNASAVSILTADWPFIPALEVTKSVTPTTYGAGELVNFTIELENHASVVSTPTTPVQTGYVKTVTSGRTVQNPANAQGAPNNTFARIDYAQNADQLTSSGGITYANPTGTITQVELLFDSYLTGNLDDDDLEIYIGGGLVTTLSQTQLNTLVGGSAQTYAITLTAPGGSWDWTEAQALTCQLLAKKTGSNDGQTIWVDSIGFRVTTNAPPPSSGTYGPTTISPLPLTDTFDNTKLAYISASEAPTSVSGGTITWANMGPLNPGVRKTITVSFRALSTASTTATTNTATATNAYFVSGRRTNDDTDDATITIEPRGSIGDRVWWDLDADGVQDGGEPGLENVLVTLSNGAQTRTDASGNYIFRGLVAGTYDVTVVESTIPWTVGNAQRTYDPDDTGNNRDGFSTVTITATQDNVLQDFGYDTTTNMITGSIFQDNDGDGIQDPGENFLVGVTVTLSGQSSATTTTNANGFYSFSTLANGSYTVTVTPPGSTIQTLDPDGAVKNNATSETATGGNIYPDNDFAYQPSGALTLGDTLYYDWNGDGDQDPGEAGITNVDVFLYEDANGNGVIDVATDAYIGVSVTNASGVYGFSSLVAGNYLVIVNTTDAQFPANVTQIQDFDSVIDSKAKVNLTASLATVDFGYQPVGTGVIGNLVWLDADNDGIKDALESGINGVSVQLYRSGQTPGVSTPYATTTTSGGGLYSFTNLPAESYTVYIPTSNFSTGNALAGTPLSSTTTVTIDNTVDNDDNGSQSAFASAVSSPVIVLSTGETDNTKDFGFVGVGSVGDFVFYDANANGQLDFSETGIANVTVKIFLDADSNGVADSPTPVATAVTADGSGSNPVGFYRFDNLTPGTYFVQVDTATLPAGLTYTSDPDRDGVPVGSPPALPAGDNADSLVLVSSGSNYSGADFGYQPPGAIGDFVWFDLNQDGVQDSGEPGIAGVSIVITDGTTTHTVTTDPNGYWSKTLPDGNWTVSIPTSNFSSGNPLENLAATYDANGIGTLNTVSLSITAGNVNLPVGNLGIDFGYKLNGNYGLSGTIAIHDTGLPGTADDIDDFFDDGVDLDAGPADETELSGVEVFLYTSGGGFLGSTFTDANGDYAFTGLISGSYRVIIGTTAAPLDQAVLTTTTANNLSGSTVSNTATSVTQLLTISTSSVVNVDFTFNSTENYDFGDLPDSYGMTTLAQDGARHIIPASGSTLYLGTVPDADTNGLPSALANGDDNFGSDDENGVTLVSPAAWTNGTVGTSNGGDIQVSVTGTGWLVGWIDWNNDGDFLDSGEFIANQAVSSGSSTISFDIPAGTIGATSESWLSRFRVFTNEPAFAVFSYEGVATDGEVEDYLIEKPLGGSIGDLVWNDANGDSSVSVGEQGISGRIVELRNNLNMIVATQTTGTGSNDVDGDGVIDPPGYYRFRGLAAGTYSVTVTNPPAGFDPSYDENGIGTANVTSVTLAADVQHLTADFGYKPKIASISGQVRFDTDSDGDLLDTDLGAAFVRIQLWTDPDGDGNPSDGVQVAETFTHQNGSYVFNDVPTGKYAVLEINPAGATSTADVDSGNPDRIAVTMLGVNITGRDFLDTLPTLYAISGKAFEDNNVTADLALGIDDYPIEGITIRLFLDRNGDGLANNGDPEIGTASTNTQGFYSFAGLQPGYYVVVESDPPGSTSIWDAQGAPADNLIPVTLVASNVTQRDFLDNNSLGGISGTVRADTTGDGNADITLQGVVLNLLNASGQPVLDALNNPRTATTNVSGFYSFTDLAAGVYQVAETQPSGYGSLSDKDGGNPNLIGDQQTIPVSNGSINTGNDFLEFLQACPDKWVAWQQKWNTLLDGDTGTGTNPDGDRYKNLLEYAFCMPPHSGVRKPFCLVSSVSVAGAVDGVYSRTAGGAQDVTYVLEHTAALGNPTVWSNVTLNGTNTVVTNNGNGTESVRIIDLETITGRTAGSGFVRIRITLDDGATQATDTTETLGWVETALGVCCVTYNNPFLRCATFTGTVDSVDGQDLVVTNSTGPFNLADSLEAGLSYYVEVTSGENEGRRYDVLTANNGRITLVNDSDIHAATAPFNTNAGAPPANLAGDTIVMHRHHSLAGLFPPSGFGATEDQASADDVQVFAGGAWKIYWLYDDAGTPRWVDAADAGVAEMGATVMPPGQGMFFHNRHTAKTLLAYGEVRESDFIRPMQTGSNLVGGGYPVNQSINGSGGRAMNTGTGFSGSLDFKTADSVFIWRTDETTTATGYHTYYLLNGGSLPQRWVKVGDNTLVARDGSPLLLRDRSVFVRAKNGAPIHKTPAPWTP